MSGLKEVDVVDLSEEPKTPPRKKGQPNKEHAADIETEILKHLENATSLQTPSHLFGKYISAELSTMTSGKAQFVKNGISQALYSNICFLCV